MAQTLIVSFTESPLSPRGMSLLRSNLSPLPDTAVRFPTVGCISAVNSRVGEFGLQKRGFLPPLVAEGRMEKSDQSKGDKKKVHDKEEKQTDAKLIEFATFPGFNPDYPTPLPHGLDTLEQMRRITSAQMRFAVKRYGLRECWRKLFYSPASQTIFQDTFWWIFLSRHQPNQAIQDKLFSRISDNYVSLLCERVCESETWRDLFFKVYPDVIAQCVYTAFIHGFPASWNSFDDDFKTEICRIISLWQVGTQPIPNSWKRWNLDQLEPPNLLKNVGKEEQSPTSPRKGFNLDALVREAKEKTGAAPVKTRGGQKSPSVVGSSQPKAATKSQSKITTSVSTLASASKQLVTASPATTSKKQLQKGSWAVSFVDLERALSSSSQVMQQPLGNARTAGEATPPLGSTATQSRKIEVAKQQLADLKRMQIKKIQSKRTASKSSGIKPQPVPQSASCTQSQRVSQPQTQQPQRISQPQTQQPQRISQPQTQQPQRISQPQTQQPQRVPQPQTQAQAQPASATSSNRSVSTAAVPKAVPQKGQSSTARPAVKGSDATHKDDQSSDDGKQTKEQDTRTWKEKALDLTQGKKGVPTVGPKFERVVFDVHGQSPLVKHYLQKRQLSYDSGYSLLMQRTEISQLPPPDAPTYEDVIKESVQKDKTNQAQFKRHYARQKQSIVRSQQQRRKAAAKHEEEVKKILSQKKKVKQMSTELVAHALNRAGTTNTKAISAAVSQTVKTVSKIISSP